MRQLACIPSEEAARTFGDYLFSLKIETRLQQEKEGWLVWICDEDRLTQARQELEDYQRDPTSKRFLRGAQAARTLRRKQDRDEERLRRKEEQLRKAQSDAASRRLESTTRPPLTLTLLAISVAVFVLSDFGRQHYSILQYLFITSYYPERAGDGTIYWVPGLPEIMHGELWRLITPIFIHFDLMHIGFNMALLYSLGRRVESVIGTRYMVVLVLSLASISDVAAYFLAHLSWTGGHLEVHSGPNFGGMSGVLYGLFGYIWMKGHYEPDMGLALGPATVFVMLAFFVLCLTGEMGNVCNMAHLAGLLAGMFIAYARPWWRAWRRTDSLS